MSNKTEAAVLFKLNSNLKLVVINYFIHFILDHINENMRLLRLLSLRTYCYSYP